MLCEPTFAIFTFYFTISHNFGFFLFHWDRKRKEFSPVGEINWQLILWFVNNEILIVKLIFLSYQLSVLISENDLPKIVYQLMFIISNGCASITNLLFWVKRDTFPVLYKRCRYFCTDAHDDGLGGMMKMASFVTVVFSICVFLLSLSLPQMHPFFGHMLPTELVTESRPLRVGLSLCEAYIMWFSWITNIALVLILPNLALLITFWCGELRSDSPPTHLSQRGSKLRKLKETMKTYRQLQLLTSQMNECFSAQVANLFALAFMNQTAVNYGTLKLYNELPIQAWVACPYLSIDGAFNLLSMHMILSMPYESSNGCISSWKLCHAFDKASKDGKVSDYKMLRKFVRSCCPLKAKNGSLRVVKKDTGIEWVDSLIDATVNLLLWK